MASVPRVLLSRSLVAVCRLCDRRSDGGGRRCGCAAAADALFSQVGHGRWLHVAAVGLYLDTVSESSAGGPYQIAEPHIDHVTANYVFPL